jgi:predicted glycosyltransferase involved in capsule biosynthesis
VTFLIPLRIDSPSRLKNLIITTTYLNKYLRTNILVIESDSLSRVSVDSLPACCQYLFIKDDNPLLNRTRINNMLIRKAGTPIVVLHDADAVIPFSQLTEAANLLRDRKADMVSPYDGSFVGVDSLFKILFEKILDPLLLQLNQNKFPTAINRSWGGSAFLWKDSYIAAGMENENFESWGPEDIERSKRMKKLGYVLKRLNGALFHLPHERKENSSYNGIDTQAKYITEYLKVCSLEVDQLREYVSSWEWTRL